MGLIRRGRKVVLLLNGSRVPSRALSGTPAQLFDGGKYKKQQQQQQQQQQRGARTARSMDLGLEQMAMKVLSDSKARLSAPQAPRSRRNGIFLKPVNHEWTYKPISVEQAAKIPKLQHSLSRALYSPGVHFLQDPRTGVYNFDPYLKNIIPVEDFDFDGITGYVTSSKDKTLLEIAAREKLSYYSSTSSMTGVLSHFHFFLSNFRQINLQDFTRNTSERSSFTAGAQLPGSIIVKKCHTGGAGSRNIYSIDSDKVADREIVLSLLGHTLEKFLTCTPTEFETLRKSDKPSTSERQVEENAYHYAAAGKFLMRSQLDCLDQRLPGTGTFDLKTRAVSAVRYDMARSEQERTGYQLRKRYGRYESFEQELFELSKSTMLKYALQARIGNMDGIFLAYHNISEMFGFQYIPLEDMDFFIHGSSIDIWRLEKLESKRSEDALGWSDHQKSISRKIAKHEFMISLKLWEEILDYFTHKIYKDKSFRLIFKCISSQVMHVPELYIIGAELSETDIEEIEAKGLKSQITLIEAEEEGSKGNLDSVVSNVKAMNTRMCQNPRGFKLVVRHRINGELCKSNRVNFTSLSDTWDVEPKLIPLTTLQTRELYDQFMDEKLELFKKNGLVKDDDEVSKFTRVLRTYGKRGEKTREELKDKAVVWNRD